MVHPEVAIHPHIGRSDRRPSLWSLLQTGEVKGGDVIGIMLKTAAHTPEEGLTSPISFVDASTSWAGYGGVFRLNIDDWYPSFKSLIFDKGLKLSESPAVKVSILASPMLSVHTDSSELLHHNYVAFLKRVHKRSADLVQSRIDVSPLSSAQPFQPPFSRGCAFALERGAELSKVMPSGEDFPTLSPESVGSDEKVLHPNVHSDWVASFRLWNLLFNRNVEEERFISVNQDSVGRFSFLKKLSLIVSYIEHRFNSLLKCGDRSVDSIRLVDKPEKPLIQIQRKFRELKRLISSLLVCFGYSISGSDGEVCWKLELLPRLSINHVVKGYWIEHPCLKGYFRNVVTRILKSFKCSKKLLCILFRRLKLADYSFRELHSKKHICKFYYLRFKPQFLSATEVGSLLEVVR
jgi:hypothetical protein